MVQGGKPPWQVWGGASLCTRIWSQLGDSWEGGAFGAEAHRCGEAFLSPEEWHRAGVVHSGQRAPRHLPESVTETLVQSSRGSLKVGASVYSLEQTRLWGEW